MMIADLFIEPSEQLWAGIPAFLWTVFVLDLALARPLWPAPSVPSGTRRWPLAVALTLLGLAVLWWGNRLVGRPEWWYPTWAVLLIWTIAARESALAARKLGLGSVAPWILTALCVAGGVVGLTLIARSRSPADEALLACLIVITALLSALWVFRSYRHHGAADGGRQRLPATCRLASFVLLAVILLNPVLRHQRVRYDRACLIVLMDDSRSMSIRDVLLSGSSQPISRVGALNTSMTSHQYEFGRIRRELDVLIYRFAERLASTDEMSVRAEGQYTAIGDAIRQAYDAALQNGRPVAGILLFSDGANNVAGVSEPAAAAAALAAGHVPLWAVGVGSETPSGQTRTIIPRNLLMARRVAAMNQLPITAEFSFVGFRGQSARVELLFDDEVVDRQRIDCSMDSEARQIRFLFVPRVGGLHKVTVRATPEQFKLDGPPAELSQYLHVTDEVIRVLYVEGKPRYEGTFLVRALATCEQVRLHKILLAAPGDEDVRTSPGGPAGQWQWYHVIILGDMAPGQLRASQMQAIRQYVADGGCGLAMAGARGLLASGAMAGTPLADLLPMSPTADWIERLVTVTPTQAGLKHPVCQIDEFPQAVAERWRGLAPMRGACRLTGIKPAAQVLATSQDGQPMIVVQAFGAGNVLALAFDSTWQWCMQHDDGASYHRRFWREVVLWLANRKPAVWIAADHPRYQLPLLMSRQQRVEIRAGVDSPIKGHALTNIRMEARMALPDGESVPLTMTPGTDHYAATVQAKTDGTYGLELVVRSDDREIGRATGEFIVESPDLEMTRQLADFDLLRELAARTEPAGGRFLTLDNLSEVLRQIGTNDYRRRHEETVVQRLSHDGRWRLWGLFCGLLFVEWVIRKRRGLV